MSYNRIELKLTAIDNASSVIAGASDKIAASLRNVEAVQNDFSRAVTNSVAPLTEAEQAQLQQAASSLQLKDAQMEVQTKQDELNQVIRQYGVDSKEAAAAVRDLNAAQEGLASAQSRVVEETKRASINYKDLTISVAGVATAGFALYNAYDNIRDIMVSVDRANLAVKSSQNQLEDTQRRYNDAVEKYGSASEEAQAAQSDLTLAVERNGVALERANMLQGNYNETIVRSAISVLPSVITMTASLASNQEFTVQLNRCCNCQLRLRFHSRKDASPVAPTATLTAAVGALNAVLLA